MKNFSINKFNISLNFVQIFSLMLLLPFCSVIYGQNGWERHGDPVLDVGNPGEWDDELVGLPDIIFDGNSYHMWYTGYDGTNTRIGYATSPDGITWAKYGQNPVLDVGGPGTWDDDWVLGPRVVIVDTVYHMWYTGDDGLVNEYVGHATSPNGINWTKDPNNPVLDWGPPGSWDDANVAVSFVSFESDTFHMWYDGIDGTFIRVGYATATNPNGQNWTKYANNPVLDVGVPGSWDIPRTQCGSIVFFAGTFYMSYYGGSYFNWQIGFAIAPDRVNWTKDSSNPNFIVGPPGSWDDYYVSHPYVLSTASELKMWYMGGTGLLEGKIGYATAPVVSTDTIHVPTDYTTIQAAINAASNGDIVLVAEGTYYENINYRGKAITVASHFLNDGNVAHIENTIINGSQPSHPDSGSVVLFVSGEDTTSVLCGFTITGGTGTLGTISMVGGGIAVYQSGAQIKNNIIEFNIIDNFLHSRAGGIYVGDDNNSTIVIKNNVIRNNTCNATETAVGGGILISTNGYGLISNNRILDNTVTASSGGSGGGIDVWGPINEVHIISNYIKGNTTQTNNNGGGGIDIYDCTTNTPVIENNVIVGNSTNLYGGGILVDLPGEDSFKSRMINSQNTTANGDVLAEQFLTNNTLYNNSAGVAGGGIYTNDVTSEIMNSILWENTAPSNPQIAGTVNVTYSDIEGGYTGTGNINVNPEFDLTSEYYALLSSSPCIDAGNPDAMYNDVEDPNNLGNPLLPALGTLTNDMGHCGGPSSLWSLGDWPVPVESSEQYLSEYALMHNYPNPFNPTTTIKYDIKKLTMVELKVFDILGREVVTLVKDEKPAGSYDIEFNASSLPSGIYFYRLQAGDYIETKKMVLMK